MLDQRIELTSLKDASAQVFLVTVLATLLIGFSVGFGVGYSFGGGSATTSVSSLLSVAGKPGTTGKPTTPPDGTDVPTWDVSESRSPIDDSPTVSLGLDASKPARGSFGSSSTRLIIRCREHDTDLYVAVDDYLGSDNSSVIYRIDNGASRTASWSLSTDGKAVFAPAPIAFARQLAQAKTFFIRISDFRGSTYDVEFNLSGLGALLPKVSTACKWN
jgi:hypothetical protein